MSKYIDWHELSEAEQKLSNKIITECLEMVDCKAHYVEVEHENAIYQCEIYCQMQQNLSITETASFDSNEIEQPCDWDLIENYCNQYLNQGRE